MKRQKVKGYSQHSQMAQFPGDIQIQRQVMNIVRLSYHHHGCIMTRKGIKYLLTSFATNSLEFSLSLECSGYSRGDFLRFLPKSPAYLLHFRPEVLFLLCHEYGGTHNFCLVFEGRPNHERDTLNQRAVITPSCIITLPVQVNGARQEYPINTFLNEICHMPIGNLHRIAGLSQNLLEPPMNERLISPIGQYNSNPQLCKKRSPQWKLLKEHKYSWNAYYRTI